MKNKYYIEEISLLIRNKLTTYNEVESKTGISRNTLNNWRKGKYKKANVVKIKKLADFFNMNADVENGRPYFEEKKQEIQIDTVNDKTSDYSAGRMAYFEMVMNMPETEQKEIFDFIKFKIDQKLKKGEYDNNGK